MDRQGSPSNLILYEYVFQLAFKLFVVVVAGFEGLLEKDYKEKCITLWKSIGVLVKNLNRRSITCFF